LSFSTASRDGGGRFTHQQQPAPDPDSALQPQAKRPDITSTSLTRTAAGAADWRA